MFKWETDQVSNFSYEAISQLIEGRVPAVRLQGFSTNSETQNLVDALASFSAYSQSIKQVLRIGLSQYQEGLADSKENYFKKAKELLPRQTDVFHQSFNPVERLCSLLSEIGYNTSIMHEPGFGDYYAGNAKYRTGTTPIHIDYAPQDSAGWAVYSSHAQLSWNLYIKNTHGGKLQLWDKYWQSDDDLLQHENGFHYRRSVVKNCKMLEIDAIPGELLLINSRKYHAVSESKDRLAFGSFISHFPENHLRFWS
jgi:hypothetical protein